MNNFSIKVNGKEYWISRSLAVAVFIFRKVGNKFQVLLEKRGKGAADNIGKWCCVCGFLDYNETLEEAAKRESKEETGFEINTEHLTLVKINSDPSEKSQTVTTHYVYFANEDEDFNLDKAQGGEKDEIETVEWFDIGTLYDENHIKIDIYKIYERNFAFEHDKLIIEHLSKFYNLKYKD